MRRVAAFVLALSCLGQGARAEPPPPAVVEGRVVDRVTRAPVAGARVAADGLAASTVADEAGRFRLEVPPGTVRLHVDAAAYQGLETTETVASGAVVEVRYAVTPEATSGYETVVTAAPIREEVSRRTLQRAEVTQTPGTMGDPFRVIDALPGVVPIVTGVPYYYVRGAPPADTGYFVDGVRVPALFHLALGPSVVHPSLIDRVDFWTGGAPARYPGYVGGLVAATTAELPADRPHLDLDLRLVDVGGIVSAPFGGGRTRVSASGRYSYTAALLSLLAEELFVDYWDYQLRLEHRLSPRAQATLFAFGSYDEIGELDTTDADGRRVARQTTFAQAFHRLDARVDLRLDGGRRLQLGLGTGLEQTFIGDGSLDIFEVTVGPRVIFRTPLGPDLVLGLGAEGSYARASFEPGEWNDPDDPFEDDIDLPERGLGTVAAWTELRARLAPETIVTAGARATAFHSAGATHTALDPRLAVRHELVPRFTLTGSLGMYHQPPAFVIPVPGIGNLDFERGLQRALQASQGFEWQPGFDLAVEAQVFFHRYENLSDLDIETSVEDGEDGFPRMEGNAYGVELIVRRKLADHLFGWFAYTLSRSERSVGAYPSASACPPTYEVSLVRPGTAPSDADRTQVANLVASYELPGGFRIGARVHYRSGRPFTRKVCWNDYGYERDGNGTITGRRGAERMPDYLRLDLRLDKRWRYRAWDLEVYFEVINVTFAREVLEMDQPQRDDGTFGAPRVPSDTPPLVIPTLGLRAVL